METAWNASSAVIAWVSGIPGPISAILGVFLGHFLGSRRQRSDEKRQHRMARMVIVNQLFQFIKACDDLVTDHDNADTPIGQWHGALPAPQFEQAMQYLATLPPPESEQLVELARDVVEENASVSFLQTVGSADDDELQPRAARLALKAICFHDKMALKIMWKSYQIDGDRVRYLERCVSDWEERTLERNAENARMAQALFPSDALVTKQ